MTFLPFCFVLSIYFALLQLKMSQMVDMSIYMQTENPLDSTKKIMGDLGECN